MKLKAQTTEGGGVWAYRFYCPGCDMAHKLPVRGHGDRYEFNGDLEAPTFKPDMLRNPGQITKDMPVCHCWIVDGMIHFASDCTHHLANQIVPMPEWREA